MKRLLLIGFLTLGWFVLFGQDITEKKTKTDSNVEQKNQIKDLKATPTKEQNNEKDGKQTVTINAEGKKPEVKEVPVDQLNKTEIQKVQKQIKQARIGQRQQKRAGQAAQQKKQIQRRQGHW
ncbi:MAG: hypothetical protein M0P66_06735 [Salinivirgaceae bacterium]|nr:hypothetical protein [Salinivirgaceae bacterium]